MPRSDEILLDGACRTVPPAAPALVALFGNRAPEPRTPGEEPQDGPGRAEIPAPEPRLQQTEEEDPHDESGDEEIGAVVRDPDLGKGKPLEPQEGEDRPEHTQQRAAEKAQDRVESQTIETGDHGEGGKEETRRACAR